MRREQSKVGIVALTIRLFRHITPRRRMQFLMLLALTLAGSVAEVVSLGAVVPFIGVLTEPRRVFGSPRMAQIVHALGIQSPPQLVLPLTIAFALAAVLAGTLRVLLLWVSTMLANATGTDLSVAVYRRTLYQPYPVHIARSSSEIISGLTQKVTIATSVLMSLVTVGTSAMLFCAILLTLVAIDPAVAVVSGITFGLGYAVIAWRTRTRLHRNSSAIALEQTRVVKALQEGLGAIRDVLVDGTQSVYTAAYYKAVKKLQRATGENSFITLAPRFAMETLGLVLIAGLAYSVTQRQGHVGSALPVLAAMALGAQRLLPLLQQLYGNWSVVAGNRAALMDVLALLEQPLPDGADSPPPPPLSFTKHITFQQVRFRYEAGRPWVLDGINLTVQKGSRIGIVGTTGSGKSTALDVLMALLEPTEGALLVDGRRIEGALRRAWQGTIAHVPQTIYLADAPIAENIAFGVPPHSIDMDRVRNAAVQAQLAPYIESRTEGYASLVGERGVRLSGGQRQRIGIARALYKQATVLILDEATSALDADTEAAVVEAIDQLNRDLTVFVVAHRLTSLRHCELVVRLEQGRVVSQGSYEQASAERLVSATTASETQ